MLLFQICQGCYALYLKRTTHNDLHIGNVLLSFRNNNPVNICYILPDTNFNRKEYTFKDVHICARIFDFDKSYTESLGDNKYLDASNLCVEYHQCNKVVESKDIAQVVCGIYKHLHYVEILQVLVEDNFLDEVGNLFKQTWGCYGLRDSKRIMDISPYLLSYPEILQKIYKLYLDYGGEEWKVLDKGDVYTCMP